jgi:hypothetical protein
MATYGSVLEMAVRLATGRAGRKAARGLAWTEHRLRHSTPFRRRFLRQAAGMRRRIRELEGGSCL